jgi:hypothetical protein
VTKLPSEGLVPRSEKYFHAKLALDNIIWTVDENVLNLSGETGALAASYDYGGLRATLLIVAYPEAGAAQVALDSLRAASSETLSVAAQQDHYVVAVFESPEDDAANDLVRRTLALLP